MEKEQIFNLIKDLVTKEAQTVATKVYNDLGTKYGVAQIPTHTHNGVDSNQIPYKNIVQGNKYGTLLSEDVTETVTIGGIFNPTRITMIGFAANNADGSPATKRAILNGAIEFGSCFEFSDLTPPYTVTTSGSGKPFLQYADSMYVDSADLTKNKVFVTIGAGSDSTAYCVYSKDDTGTVFATVQATSYDNQLGTLKLDVVVGTNVKMFVTFVIT